MRFGLTIVDEAMLNGSRMVNATATDPHYAINSTAMKVHDNESSILSLTLPPSASEKSNSLFGGEALCLFRLLVNPAP